MNRIPEFRSSLPAILEGRDPMDQTPDGHIRCEQCRMTFRVGGYAEYADPTFGKGDVTRCAEPGCGRRFWHLGHNGHGYGQSAVVGVFPDDANHPLKGAAE